jgi:hypothetical protein
MAGNGYRCSSSGRTIYEINWKLITVSERVFSSFIYARNDKQVSGVILSHSSNLYIEGDSLKLQRNCTEAHGVGFNP